MSEPETGSGAPDMHTPPTLPPAAVDVTAYRRVVEQLARPGAFVRIALVAFVVAVVLLIGGIVTLAQVTRSGAVGESVASGVVGVGLLLALLVVLPAQLDRRNRRRLRTDAVNLRDTAAIVIRERLASIGYVVPLETARAWLDPTVPAPAEYDSAGSASVDSASAGAATVALVHGSVIAARLWRLSESDERVFLEPYLRQVTSSAALPVLPAV